ncbi:MAG: 6-phosphofructokinase [Calditrichaeota bacterium]|nr:6-phosphofructokinase [Calditrichota bacterium]
MSASKKNIGILTAGGPCPGINAVIAAALLYANEQGVKVITLHQGFKWIMQGDITHVSTLSAEDANRIHYRGGSLIHVARDNPTKDSKFLENTIDSLQRLNIDKLITIGGDDTAYSALSLEEKANGRIQVVHVPKTIDNDLDLPPGVNTFGFQTARHVGATVIENLLMDAQTATRWYFVIAMGRKAGHLALGIGNAAAAQVSIIPEEFAGKNKLTLDKLTDILVGAIVKRLSSGFEYGVAVLAEGLVEAMTEESLKDFPDLVRDEHGNIRFAEVDFGDIIKKKVIARLAEFKLTNTIISKDLGYELRCADPIAYDKEYSRQLGYCASKYILEGGNRAMVSIQDGKFVPMFFDELVDSETGRPRIRMVDVTSEAYQIARQYMTRLTTADFRNQPQLEKYAETTGIDSEEFIRQFKYIVKDENISNTSYRPEDL